MAETEKAKSVLVLHSGGLDSTVLLADYARRGFNIMCMSVNYGQRHARELRAARDIQKKFGVAGVEVDLSVLKPFLKGSSQTDPSVAVPKGHYEDASMKITVVPNRNMMMLSVAVAAAISQGRDFVGYAAHAGDHAIYPDCRPTFVGALQRAVQLCDWKPPMLEAPFINMSKTDIVKMGARIQAPMDMTWSCYEGGANHCGKCGTCVERKEAFKLAKVPDPTVYDA